MKIVASNSITVSKVDDGTITHTAWSYSADGTDRFTTVYPNLNLLKGTKTLKSITGNNTVNQGGLLYSFDNNNTLNNQGFSVNDTVTFEFDWSATNPASGTFILQWQGQPWGFNVPQIKISSTNGSGHVTHTFNITDLQIASTAVATGIGYRFDNIPTNTIITFSNVIISKAKTSQPWMQSSSEVTTADWPKYIGHYTDFMQANSTNPSDYTWGPMRGDDGVGVTSTVITYAISTSGTTAPTTGWTSSIPSPVKGQYLWTKTVWTYTDNSSETGYSVTYISKDGNNGTDGTSGIIVSSVAPASPQNGQLWQDTSTTPQLVKKWTGSSWVIWELYVENMNVNNLSALSSNLGDITAGTYTSWSIEDYETYDYLSAIYMFKGGIRFFTIENPNITDPDTSGVASGKFIRGMSVISGVVQFHQQSVPSGDTRTANEILKEVDGFWTRNPNSAVGGYCGSISSYKYPNGFKQLSIDTDNLQILAKATARGQRGYAGNVMLSSEARAVNIVPNAPYIIGSLANFDALKLYGQLFARRNFTLELDLTGPQLQYPDFAGYTRMVSATTGSRNEGADSREFMVYACINSALNTLLFKVFYRDGGGNWTENTNPANNIYKVVPIIY